MKHLDFFGSDSPGKHMQRATREQQLSWALNARLTNNEIWLYYDYEFDLNKDHVIINLKELSQQQINVILWDITVNGGIILA